MSSSSPPPYTYVYKSIIGVPEYVNHVFTWNSITTFTLLNLLYTIPGVWIYLKIVRFYWRNGASFLLMQLWNNVAMFTDFLMIRIPSTTIWTSFCAGQNPQLLIKLIVFLYYWSFYSTQLLTVTFCVLRIAILWFASVRSRKQIVHRWSPAIILLSVLAALPHIFSDGLCIQLFQPYPFGSIFFNTQFHMSNLNMFVLTHLLLTCSCTVVIVVLNIVMVLKIRQRKFGVSLRIRAAAHNSRAERALTGTMIILVVPMIVSELIALGELFNADLLSYIILLRPLFVDARVHLVSAYFYMTHPVFKKKTSSLHISNSHTILGDSDRQLRSTALKCV
uniref:Serpentine receptor class gamma n=1 Tax=Caenorhabditis japonica TaxID=281687 RepID=A0A8R1DL67_CAEJA